MLVSLQPGSRSSRQPLQRPMSTPFLRGWILKFRTRVRIMFPCQIVNEYIFVSFPRHIFGFCTFWGVLRDPTFPAKKTNTRKGLGRSTLNTCEKVQGLFQKMVLTTVVFLCGKREKMTASPGIYLVSVWIRFWAFKVS